MTTKIRAALVVVAWLHSYTLPWWCTDCSLLLVIAWGGWCLPAAPIAYTTWADTQTFVVATYWLELARKVSIPATPPTQSPSKQLVRPTLLWTRLGDYYFIGTMDRHCPLGQKLAIKVIDSSAGPSPPPSPRSAVTYTVGDILGWVVPPLGEVAYSTWLTTRSSSSATVSVRTGNNTSSPSPFSLFLMVFLSPFWCSFQLHQRNTGRSSGDKGGLRLLQHQQHHRRLRHQSNDHHSHHHRHACTTSLPPYELHCGLGQKLAINVIAKSTAPSPSGAATPPSSSVGASPSAGGPTAPPPSSSAPSRIVAGLSLCYLLP
ncbi:hypothetical protein CK203_013172 [Vitis vinifera]|uniref:Phytocyanin domain-containing protein n=1 Tax=Vitis vinifera TaxID=29760 RepID=A0A438JQA1_VITVI|nr:hypothetical protein CK203_013172 [Vitis vinifera]